MQHDQHVRQFGLLVRAKRLAARIERDRYSQRTLQRLGWTEEAADLALWLDVLEAYRVGLVVSAFRMPVVEEE